MEKLMLDTTEVAKMLNVSRTTIYTMCRENEIPHIRIRGKISFNRDVIKAWTRGEYTHDNENETVNS